MTFLIISTFTHDSSLLTALSRSRDINAPLRASEVFDQMIYSGVKADTFAWTILITIWSRSKLPNKENKVQEIFEKMISMGAAANAVTYTSLLIMWTKSKQTQSKTRIKEIYHRLWDEFVRLDGMAFKVCYLL